MATYNWGFDYPMTACGNQDSNQYKFVTTASGGDDKVFELASGASAPAPIGILQDDPESGNAGQVRLLGISKVVADAEGTAIGYGDFLTAGSTGMAVHSAGSSVAAVALEALASGSGVYIECFVLPYASGNKADNTP